MTATLQQLANDASAGDVPAFVDRLLQATLEASASDLHLLPTPVGADVKWRIDGVLQPCITIPAAIAGNVVIRLKVMAGLLTYQTQTPQEGRLESEHLPVQIRIGVFPTVHGEKLVARLFDRGDASQATLHELALPASVLQMVQKGLSLHSGAVMIVGPAGSGKTTTSYACLREILRVSQGSRSVVSLEDPIEVLVPGVAQSEVAPEVGFDFAQGLRSLVRQDPEVILVGEIRDQETARVALQAAMTGQLLLTTFHASDGPTALDRLHDMGIPAYVIQSALSLIVTQRLIRVLCPCAQPDPAAEGTQVAGLAIKGAKRATGCGQCRQLGYAGRRVVADALWLADPLAIVDGDTEVSPGKRQAGIHASHQGLARQAVALVNEGVTSLAEAIRAGCLADHDFD